MTIKMQIYYSDKFSLLTNLTKYIFLFFVGLSLA